MRRAAKRDANEAAIVQALEFYGCIVRRLSDANLPDLICARRGRLYLLEVKSEKGTLRPGQAACRLPFVVVRDVDEALVAVGAAEPC